MKHKKAGEKTPDGAIACPTLKGYLYFCYYLFYLTKVLLSICYMYEINEKLMLNHYYKSSSHALMRTGSFLSISSCSLLKYFLFTAAS